jgi:caffeoyl-CoA O-methyltransferase
MEIVAPLAEQYAANHSTPISSVLQQLAQYTTATHPKAHMLSGSVQGQFLSLLSKLLQPTTILEVGTFTGFSALCLAQGLQANGSLHTIELRQEDATTAQKYFDVAANKNIYLHIGNAIDIIPTLTQTWDMVFLDADKVNYINYYELILPQLKSGGCILADNVLFHGEVLNENITGKNAKAIHAFNQHVMADARVQCTLLTIRDGLMLIRKK